MHEDTHPESSLRDAPGEQSKHRKREKVPATCRRGPLAAHGKAGNENGVVTGKNVGDRLVRNAAPRCCAYWGYRKVKTSCERSAQLRKSEKTRTVPALFGLASGWLWFLL